MELPSRHAAAVPCRPGIVKPSRIERFRRAATPAPALNGMQRRAHRRPGRIAAEVRDRRLQRRDHRELLEQAARVRDRALALVGARLVPGPVEVGDGAGVDVAGRGDAAHAAVAHVGEQEILAAGEDLEAVAGEALEHRARVVPVTGGVLDADDGVAARSAAGARSGRARCRPARPAECGTGRRAGVASPTRLMTSSK